MDEEVKLTTSQRGTGRASADIVVWKNEDEKKKKKTAFLVVELKAPELRLKVEDCYQGYNYATWSRAKLFAISNGKELQVYKTVEEELPLKLQPVNDIPHIDTIQDDKKLEESLAKTKEFTGDEFAKLLHKCHNIIRNNAISVVFTFYIFLYDFIFLTHIFFFLILYYFILLFLNDNCTFYFYITHFYPNKP